MQPFLTLRTWWERICSSFMTKSYLFCANLSEFSSVQFLLTGMSTPHGLHRKLWVSVGGLHQMGEFSIKKWFTHWMNNFSVLAFSHYRRSCDFCTGYWALHLTEDKPFLHLDRNFEGLDQAWITISKIEAEIRQSLFLLHIGVVFQTRIGPSLRINCCVNVTIGNSFLLQNWIYSIHRRVIQTKWMSPKPKKCE